MKRKRRILAGFCCALCICAGIPGCAEAAWEEFIVTFGTTWGDVPDTFSPPEPVAAPAPAPAGDTSFYNDGRAVSVNSYILPDESTRYLTQSDVEQLTWKGIRYAINEIYARNGYVFVKKEELKNYFNGQTWYDGGDTSDQEVIKSRMNSYEVENVRLLVELETTLYGGEYELY